MIVSRAISGSRILSALLLGLFALALPTHAQQSPPPTKPMKPVLIAPQPDYRFQQAVQRQQARDRVQQSQLEQQLRQGVSKNASRPSVADPKVQQRFDQAVQAQQNRDRAAQKNLLKQYRQTPVLPRVIPTALPPPDVSKQGH